MNAQKESLKITFRVHVSSHSPIKKCEMKMKETEKMHTQNIFNGYKLHTKKDLDEL